ncbi:MAG: carbohydrate ABC transporter substrate-binding protein [Acholeplasmataceae bacterium]|nr:carbohydrate ABC transporter substrate-binding protein [Acholeplasmataceae bacterium]
MKKGLLFSLIFILFMFFIGCDSSTTSFNSSIPTISSEDVTFSFSWWGTTDRNVATYQAIELFESKYPQYKISGDQSTWDGYQTTLYNRLERNREADIFQVNYNWLYSMYGEYYFLDLSELGIDFSHYPEMEHDPLTINGKILGLSLSETGYIFYMNKAVYEEAGITEMPTTWDELIQAGQTIGGASGGSKYAIGRLDAQQVSILMFSYLSQKYGKNLISSNNKLNFSREELEEGFAFINTLRSNNVLIPNNTNDTHTNGPTNPNWVIYQNYGGILQWNTAVSEYENELPDTSNLVTLGMFQQNEGEELGMYKKVSMALAVSKRVENDPAKQQAIKTFIEFITTDPEAIRILGVDRGVPSHDTAYNTLLNSTTTDFTSTREWEGHVIVQTLFNNQLEEDINLYIHPYYEHDVFRRIYEMPIEKFLFNQDTAAQAINEIINKFDSTLAQVMGG